jgi:hypothetical protein
VRVIDLEGGEHAVSTSAGTGVVDGEPCVDGTLALQCNIGTPGRLAVDPCNRRLFVVDIRAGLVRVSQAAADPHAPTCVALCSARTAR